MLQLEEWAHHSILEGEQFAVEQQVVRDRAGRRYHFGKGGGDLIQVA